MNQQVKIEHLKSSDIPEVVELFIQAFKDYPLIPAFQVKPKLNKMLLKAAIDMYRRMKTSMLYGIRKEGELICASLSASSLEKPSTLPLISILPLIRFIPFIIRLNISMLRALGWRKAKELGNFFRKVFYKEKQKHKEPYLELVLFGTLPKYQRQGFGRKMLNFLYDEAKSRGYKGITLLTNRDIPAFRLYLKEGFIVDKEFILGEIRLCWVRLMF